MFLGHFAVGFAAKKAAPEVSLGTWFLACQFLDVLWPVFLLMGWEKVAVEPGNTVVTPLNFEYYPWSHSLLMAAVWALLFAGVHFAIRRRAAAALLLGAVVLSHWPLDYLVHRPELPLYPGGPMVGLALWNSLPLTLLAEYALFAIGFFIYGRGTRALDRKGRLGLMAFGIFMAVMYAANVFGPPPPPRIAALAGSALVFFGLLLAAAVWVDRHRAPRRG